MWRQCWHSPQFWRDYSHKIETEGHWGVSFNGENPDSDVLAGDSSCKATANRRGALPEGIFVYQQGLTGVLTIETGIFTGSRKDRQ